MENTEWATIGDIISDAENPRELVVEYVDIDGKLCKAKIFYCELTGEEASIGEFSRLIDLETQKPKDPSAIIEYNDNIIMRRLCKASGKKPGYSFTPETWNKLPETVRGQIRQKMSLADKERQDVFLPGPTSLEQP